MHRATVLLATGLFMMWLLPVGIFIKPSQEKLACGGRRAVCLCCVSESPASTNTMEKTNIGNNSGTIDRQKDASGGGAGNYYLAVQPYSPEMIPQYSAESSLFSAYQNPFSESIEHVPKS